MCYNEFFINKGVKMIDLNKIKNLYDDYIDNQYDIIGDNDVCEGLNVNIETVKQVLTDFIDFIEVVSK
jgi:hypothetical protein